jgi:hypothetical protein
VLFIKTGFGPAASQKMYTTCSISKDIYGSSPAFTEKSKITEFKKEIMNSFLTFLKVISNTKAFIMTRLFLCT